MSDNITEDIIIKYVVNSKPFVIPIRMKLMKII